MPTPKIDAKALTLYRSPAWQLIPLHLPADTRTKKGKTRKVGKAPLDLNWTVRPYNTPAVVARAIKENRNTGVRLKADQLVVDIDPRNGGTEGWKSLCDEIGLNPYDFPTVVTGSGGEHCYMSKPEGVPIMDTLKDFPGVEFKSKGRQVVAAGSIHPDTLKHYRWKNDTPPLSKLPKVPPHLLNLIKRPQRDSAVTGGGQATQLQIAQALSHLNPEDFRDYDTWMRLGMACHHASNGDARSEYTEWSCLDPNYADDAERIGRHWDSFHADRKDGISFQTLNHYLREAGAPNAQITSGTASDDFDDEPMEEDDAESMDFEGPEPEDFEGDTSSTDEEDDGVKDEEGGSLTEESLAALAEFNERYCAVMEGAKFKIAFLQSDPVMNRDVWVLAARQDFETLHSNRKIERDTKGMGKNAAKTMTLGKAWIEWPMRRTAKSLLFDPSGQEHIGHLNTWRGFDTVATKHGEWSRLNELIFEVLADGHDSIHQYILNWLRYLIQHPEEPPEVALVFKGAQGTGKGTLGKIVAELIGRHAIAIASPELITGRFNSHLQDVIFLFADEAIKPYDKQAESRLKAFITEPRLTFEGKGRDAVAGRNCLHIMMASNEDWVIPADSRDGYVRRFMMSNANTRWQHKHEKFKAVWEQMRRNDNSGFGRLMFDLKTQPIPEGWHPRKLLTTGALIEQKIRSLGPVQQFVFGFVSEGVLPFPTIRGEWDKTGIRAFAEDFKSAFTSFCQSAGIRAGSMGRANTRFLLQELREILPECRTDLRDDASERMDILSSPSDQRAQSMELPALPACRKRFDSLLGGTIDWGVPEGLDFG